MDADTDAMDAVDMADIGADMAVAAEEEDRPLEKEEDMDMDADAGEAVGLLLLLLQLLLLPPPLLPTEGSPDSAGCPWAACCTHSR